MPDSNSFDPTQATKNTEERNNRKTHRRHFSRGYVLFEKNCQIK